MDKKLLVNRPPTARHVHQESEAPSTIQPQQTNQPPTRPPTAPFFLFSFWFFGLRFCFFCLFFPQVPDVENHGAAGLGRTRRRRRDPPVRAVRVLARHGQQQRQLAQVLGGGRTKGQYCSGTIAAAVRVLFDGSISRRNWKLFSRPIIESRRSVTSGF